MWSDIYFQTNFALIKVCFFVTQQPYLGLGRLLDEDSV